MLPWTPLDPLKRESPSWGVAGLPRVLGSDWGDNHATEFYPWRTNNLKLYFLKAPIRETYQPILP